MQFEHFAARPTATTTTTVTATQTATATLTLRLAAAPSVEASSEEQERRIQWDESVVDNEGMGKKSSKGKLPLPFHK